MDALPIMLLPTRASQDTFNNFFEVLTDRRLPYPMVSAAFTPTSGFARSYSAVFFDQEPGRWSQSQDHNNN
jgi:hypothetical protein